MFIPHIVFIRTLSGFLPPIAKNNTVSIPMDTPIWIWFSEVYREEWDFWLTGEYIVISLSASRLFFRFFPLWLGKDSQTTNVPPPYKERSPCLSDVLQQSESTQYLTPQHSVTSATTSMASHFLLPWPLQPLIDFLSLWIAYSGHFM